MYDMISIILNKLCEIKRIAEKAEETRHGMECLGSTIIQGIGIAP